VSTPSKSYLLAGLDDASDEIVKARRTLRQRGSGGDDAYEAIAFAVGVLRGLLRDIDEQVDADG
jgi:hypothetical protein